MVVRNQAYDCSYQNVLPGVTVYLYNASRQLVGEVVTDNEGWYEFTGLPFGRYRVEVDNDCRRRELHEAELTFPVSHSNSHAIKFYKNGNMCDTSFSLEGWDPISTVDSTHFDTLDECCANMFWYDIDGCFSRSHIAFQFEFCIDMSGFDGQTACPLDEIRVIESAMQQGLGSNSELALTEFGSSVMSKIGGETRCIGSSPYQEDLMDQIQELIQDQEDHTNICGVVVTKEANCKDDSCLKAGFDKVAGSFETYIDDGVFASTLRYLAEDELQPVTNLHSVEVVVSSFTTRKLVLPSTVTSTEQLDEEYLPTTTGAPRFYPTYIAGQLCHSKTVFDSWEQSYGSLKECCEAFFSWDYESCCNSLDMDGC